MWNETRLAELLANRPAKPSCSWLIDVYAKVPSRIRITQIIQRTSGGRFIGQ